MALCGFKRRFLRENTASAATYMATSVVTYMRMQSAVEEYLDEIEVRKYTPKTIRSYRCNLNLFLRFCAEKLHVETV